MGKEFHPFSNIMKLTTQERKLRIHGALPPTPLYVIMVRNLDAGTTSA
jgi:hypothetical protein